MTDPADHAATNAFYPDGPRDTAAFREGSAFGGPTQEGAQLYRLLVESVREYAIFALDRTGHVLTWNPGAERFKGWKAEEIIGRHFSTFYPPEDIAAGKPSRELREAERLGSIEDDGWRLRKDGTRFWANVTITALRDDSGQLIGFAKVTRDMTERRAAEQQLRENEARFRLIVHSVRDYAIFMLDPNGRVATWNEGAERIKGYTADEIIGQHFSVFYPQDAIVTQFPQYELKVATATGRFEDEGWRVRKDGSLFWASVIITALRDETGKLVGFAKVTRDLTERRRAQERALADARRVADMEASNRAKSEFLATLSHELRTPLNAIVGWVHVLQTSALASDDQRRQALSAIDRNARIQTRLIEDLLDVSRMIQGRVSLTVAPQDLRDVIDAAVETTRPAAAAKEIVIACDHWNEPVPVIADEHRLQQVIWNLLANSVKYTPRGGRIDVSLKAEAGRAIVRVSDSGEGIDPAFLPHVFEPFRQGTTTATRSGLGLGLAIVRRLVDLHGGRISVESAGVGQGATFIVSLPMALSVAETGAIDVPPEPRFGRLRVLVAEDDADSAAAVTAILQLHGCETQTASTASECLRLAREWQADVLICDVGLPDDDGYGLLRRLRSLPEGEHLPAIALTAYSRPEDRARALAAGFRAHLSKPLDPEQLLRELTSAVEQVPGRPAA